MLGSDKIKIRRVVLPTPYPIGDIYAFVILNDPVTIIDTGVATKEVKLIWDNTLKELGLTYSDIKRIVITHGHSDHFGFAKELYEKSEAEVFINPIDKPKVTNRARYYSQMEQVIKELGVPEEFFKIFAQFLVWENPFCKDVPEHILKPIREGDRLEFDNFSFNIYEVPGHSMGHIILTYENKALTGDFIFETLTPDPIIDIDDNKKRIKTMIHHIESVEKIKAIGIEKYFPAHREYEGSFIKAYNNLKERMKNKNEMILNCLKQLKQATAFDISLCLYNGNVTPASAFIVVSEVVGRLDLLEKEGKVCSTLREGKLYFHIC